MKRSKINRISPREVPKLKRKLWALLATLIKKRDGVGKGGKCITCDVIPFSYNAQTGHCIPKSVCGVFLYFHPDNLALQCGRCNGAGSGEQGKWRGIIGEEKWGWLQKMRLEKKGMQWSDFPFLEAIEILKTGDLEKYASML